MSRARLVLVLIVSSSLCCAGPRLKVQAGTGTLGDIPNVSCSVLSYREKPGWCSPSAPRLTIRAYSDCLTTGPLDVAISLPRESAARESVPAVLPLKSWASFVSPCFKRPARGTEVVVSVAGECVTGDDVTGTTSCVMP